MLQCQCQYSYFQQNFEFEPPWEVLFLLECLILSLEDLPAQRVMRFVSSALRKIYKIRTERLLEQGVEIIFVIHILDYVLHFKVVIFYCIIVNM